MKLKKAIKLLSDKPETIDFENDPDALAALKLGVEALKCLERLHNQPYGSPLPPLPGETKE